MKHVMIMASAAMAMSVSGCAHQNAGQRTLAGAAIGAGVGAITGVALGGSALTGGVTGAAIGGLAGAAIKLPHSSDHKYYRDSRGYCYYIDASGQSVYDREARC